MAPDGSSPWVLSWLVNARPICFMLLTHDTRLAASRAACTAGNNNATRIPMMAITTRSSTSVKPCRDRRMTGKRRQRAGMSNSADETNPNLLLPTWSACLLFESAISRHSLTYRVNRPNELNFLRSAVYSPTTPKAKSSPLVGSGTAAVPPEPLPRAPKFVFHSR